VQADVKTKNGKKLKVKTLVDSRCTHTGIDKQLVKDRMIQMKPINFSFEVFNVDSTFGDQNQQTQRNTGSSGNGLKWDGHVFGS